MLPTLPGLVAHNTFYHIDLWSDGWWMRVLTVPDPHETAIIVLQDVVENDETEAPNYDTDLVIGFSCGRDLKDAISRMGCTSDDEYPPISGAVSRRMGRMFRRSEASEFMFETARERGLTRLSFTIPDDKPDTRYERIAEQLAKQLSGATHHMDVINGQRLWAITIPTKE